MGNRETWADLFRALGDSVLGVLKAEFAVLGEDWKDAGKKIGMLLGLVIISLGIVLAIILVGFYASLHAFAALFEWPLWLAGFVVCGIGLLLIAIIGTVAYFTIVRKLESPVASAKQRMGDHFAWWQQQFYVEERSLGGVDGHEETSP